MTRWTTPFTTSTSALDDALISVLLSSSRNSFPVSEFNAPLSMSASRGSMLVLPYILPIHQSDTFSMVEAVVDCGIISPCVIGAGYGLPFDGSQL